MRLIADSGSTKTDWCVVDDGMEICRVTGQGINPFQQDEETIRDIIHNDVVHRLKDVYLIDEICFYGAGCRDRMICVLEKLLSNAFDKADRIEVCSDMLGAARALFGGSEGIACILGTGSNSCLYDGKRITANVPPLGYILGDEGSGAVLGRLFVNALFKGLLPDEIRYRFQEETGYDQAYIINNKLPGYIDTMIEYEYSNGVTEEEYNEAKNAYDEALEKLDSGRNLRMRRCPWAISWLT